MTNLHQNMVILDICAKVDIYPCFAFETLRSDEFAPKHGYSWLLCKCSHLSMLCTLDSKKWRFSPKHSSSWFVFKSWHSHMLSTLDSKKWRNCIKTWLFLIFVQKFTFIHALYLRPWKVTNVHQNIVIPNFCAKVDIHRCFAL